MALVGDYLRHARETRGLAPLQIEIDTRIRANIIEALEAGDFSQLPPEPFLRGLIRTYAAYLGADSQEALRLLISDLTAPPKPKPIPQPIAPPPTARENFSFKLPTRPAPRARENPVAPPIAPDAETIAEESPQELTFPPPEQLNTEGIFPRKAPPSLVRDLTARIPLPLPALIGIGILAIIIFFACGFFALNQLSTAVSNATRRTPTITRALPTVTLPLPPGASTPIPTFAATAPPFATFPGNPTPTRTTRAQRALDSSLPLNLDIDAIENIKVIVGINGVLVFNGAMDPGTSRSWSAKDSLYFRVENAKGAEIYFNGKRVLAAVFAEKTLMERQWTANSKATPVSVKPTPPKAPTPIPTATPTPTFNIETPTPTVTKTILN